VKYTEFEKNYAEALQRGEKVYLVEKKTAIFRLLCDMDFIEQTNMELDTVTSYVQVIQELIKDFFPTLSDTGKEGFSLLPLVIDFKQTEK
jgi:hypothetical protein